jgi:hypothetical protein
VHVHFESDDLHNHLGRIRACRRDLADQLSSEISLIQGDPPRIRPQRLSRLLAEFRWVSTLITNMERMEEALAGCDDTNSVLLSVSPLGLDPRRHER